MARSRLRSALAAALLACALPVPAALAASPARVALAGTTIVSGTRSAGIPVRLTRPATLRDPLLADGAAGDVVVTTTGRFAAVVLVQERAAELDRIVMIAGRSPDSSRKLTFAYPASGFVGGAAWKLPAGDYRLYLVTDGKPATVRLRLLGLTGTTRLAPRTPVGATTAFPAAAVDTAPARAVYAVGADRKAAAARTLFFSMFFAAYPAHVDTVYSNCFYFERPLGPAPYLPGCPDPATRHITPISLPPDGGNAARHLLFNSWLPLGQGHYAGGTSLVSATPAGEVQYVQFWLPY